MSLLKNKSAIKKNNLQNIYIPTTWNIEKRHCITHPKRIFTLIQSPSFLLLWARDWLRISAVTLRGHLPSQTERERLMREVGEGYFTRWKATACRCSNSRKLVSVGLACWFDLLLNNAAVGAAAQSRTTHSSHTRFEHLEQEKKNTLGRNTGTHC